MPVDLSTIPDAARRKQRPSLKRWSVVLLILVVCGGLLTSWLWPENKAARGGLFWHCFVSAPLVLWIILLSIRWLCYLASEWPAQGWDDEREQDIANEILRGQRFLILEGMCVHLPHVVTSAALTQQFTLPQGVVLQATVDEVTQAVSYQANFDDKGQDIVERICTRLVSLLEDTLLQSKLSECCASRPITVIVQADTEIALSEDGCKEIQQVLSPMLPTTSRIQFLPLFGLADIDRWLDEPEAIEALLLLSVNLRQAHADGQGEAAVAALLRMTNKADDANLSAIRIHRPEKAKALTELNASAMQALQWGDSHTEDIAWLWLVGLGTENKTQEMLANNGLNFPCVQATHYTDIDMKAGRTGCASPWLAIALAAGNAGQTSNPQLIMSLTECETLPWWLVVHPALVS